VNVVVDVVIVVIVVAVNESFALEIDTIVMELFLVPWIVPKGGLQLEASIHFFWPAVRLCSKDEL